MKLLALFLAVSAVAFADIEYNTTTKVSFTADLKKETKLAGPFALVSGPAWLSINSQGILSGNPVDKDVGDAALQVDAKDGANWVSFKVVVHVKLRVLTLKVFSAPWCTTCVVKVPALEQKLLAKVGKPSDLVTELYVETSDDPADQPTASATAAWVKELGTNFTPVNDTWRWQEYRKWFPQGFYLPAAVLLDPFGKEVVKFTATTLDPENASNQVARALLYPAVNALDVVFVGDNSGSVSAWQAQLVSALPAFFNGLSSNVTNWRMGVVSTDPVDKPYLGFAAPFFDGTALNPSGVLSAALAKMGTSGSGIEQTFAPVLKAIGDNPTFLRPGADLSIVVVTDEDEQGVASVTDYMAGLKQVKAGGRIRQFGMFLALDFAGCNASSAQFKYAGSRFEAAINATGGKAFNFCATDLNGEMTALGRALGN